MKKNILFCMLALGVFGFWDVIIGQETLSQKRTSNNIVVPYVPDEVLVKFRETASDINIINALESVEGVIISHLKKIITYAEWKTGNPQNCSFLGEHYLLHIKVPPSLGTEKAIEMLGSNPCVEYAEKNIILQTNAIPYDAFFSERQWALNNSGTNSYNGTIGADIDALAAWDINTGSSSVIIAIIDSGIDYNHEDLMGNIWTNPGEVPNDNIDNDGNGYIDDIRGWNFSTTNEPEKRDPMDTFSHGTHVARIVGAVGNNGIGTTGVCWNVRLMPVKVGATKDVTADAAKQGIDYARANGARIINISRGWPTGSNVVLQALQTAQNAGVLVVVAAGNWDLFSMFGIEPPDDCGGDEPPGGNVDPYHNDNDQNPQYPVCYDVDNIISVLATDKNDEIAWYSNYGLYSVDIGAPGGTYEQEDAEHHGMIYSTIPNNGYDVRSGTSMAAPFVAGVAGLLLAQRPYLDWWQVKTIIMKSVDDLSSLSGLCRSHGRLNAHTALNYPTPILPAAPTNLVAVVYDNEESYNIKLNWNDNSNNENGYTVYMKYGNVFLPLENLPPDTTTYWLMEVGPGSFSFYVRAFSADGESPKTPTVSLITNK